MSITKSKIFLSFIGASLAIGANKLITAIAPDVETNRQARTEENTKLLLKEFHTSQNKVLVYDGRVVKEEMQKGDTVFLKAAPIKAPAATLTK